jgi:hypothetical protein
MNYNHTILCLWYTVEKCFKVNKKPYIAVADFLQRKLEHNDENTKDD